MMWKEDKYNPIYMFNKYKELIYEVDELWDEFQHYLRDITQGRRDEQFFEHHREPQSLDVWDQMLENMGGGWPTVTFAAAAFLLLRYQALGHDLDKELRAAHRAKIKHIANDMLHAALKRPAGAMTTTVSLLQDAGYEVLCHEKEFLELHTALFKAAKKMDIDLDQSMHDGKEEGLPYNLEFVIRYGDAMTRCPKCGSKKIAPILYGMPVFDEEMQRKVNNQELYFGGCCISDSDPQFHCFGCGKDFGKPMSAE